MALVNWGQVISVTAENILNADKVMLTLFEEERKYERVRERKRVRERGRESVS